MSKKLTQKYLKECLDYCKDTGVFTWKMRPREHFKSNNSWSIHNKNLFAKEAGSQRDTGYIRIMVDGKGYSAHRLAWFYCYGRWPSKLIDHVNGDKRDNRLENLRETNSSENSQNRRIAINNTSGFKGVLLNKRTGKWRAQLRIKGVTYGSELFNTKEEAILARKELELIHHTHPRDDTRTKFNPRKKKQEIVHNLDKFVVNQ